MAAPSSTAMASGIDAIGLGDVNGDQVADIAVASRSNGQDLVTIYSGDGTANNAAATGFVAKPLVTIADPFGPKYTGPLSIALGDFLGNGTAQLAVAPAATGSNAGAPGISLYSFSVTSPNAPNAPVDSPVTAHLVLAKYVPAGMTATPGFSLAAGRFGSDTTVDLVAAPATGGGSTVTVSSLDATAGQWVEGHAFGNIPVSTQSGLSVSVGDLTGNGLGSIAVASESNGIVGLISGKTGKWMKNQTPLQTNATYAQVAIVTGTNQRGTLVETGNTAAGTQQVGTWHRKAAASTVSTLDTSGLGIGSGNLVLASGGMVYQRSAIKNPTAQFPTASGSITPTILFATTTGSSFATQGFNKAGAPVALDAHPEPLDGVGSFLPLMPRTEPAQNLQLVGTDTIDSNLIAPMQATYTSPYSVALSNVPAAVTAGLYSTAATPPVKSKLAWGPERVANQPPSIASLEATSQVTGVTVGEELRQRVLTAYQSVIGVDYQHHHDPLWTPVQGSKWNVTSTVGYQSRGIDCTNLTAWAYANALGLSMTGETGDQASIATPVPNAATVTFDPSLSNYINPQVIARPAVGSTVTTAQGQSVTITDRVDQYRYLISELKPGDILYIDGDSGKPTHAITWLGQYGVDANGKGIPLVEDATGISPSHVDSNGHIVPEGVHIRPFDLGPTGSANSWYFNKFDHALRIIADDPTPVPPSV